MVISGASMQQSLVYAQQSCRLVVEGLPDVSAGQDNRSIGIITGWSLEWTGHPELEGRREHLQALMQVVLPYARYLISGVSRRFGDNGLPVQMEPHGQDRHRLLLRSSQPDTPPLELVLDDAELSDLVRVLDQLRSDPRLTLQLAVPVSQPLKARELIVRIPPHRRLAAPLGGAAALALAAGLGMLAPTPPPMKTSPAAHGSGPSVQPLQPPARLP